MNKIFYGSEIVNIDNTSAYHYCSLDAFLGIMNAKSVWLTSLSSTNDATETMVAKKIIKETLDAMYSRTVNDVDKKINEQDSINKILLLEKIIERNKSYKHNILEYFSFSLSCSKDKMLMWDRYNNDCKGVCLEFNLDEILKIINLELYSKGSYFFGSWVYITKIMYSENEQKEIIEEYINLNIDNFVTFEDKDFDSELFLEGIYNFFCPILKHNDFNDEDEIRILYLKGSAERLIEKYSRDEYTDGFMGFAFKKLEIHIEQLGLKESNIKFLNFNNNIKAYYSLNLTKLWSHKLIPQVIIGKYSKQDVKELRRFLDINNLRKTKISRSKIVYNK